MRLSIFVLLMSLFHILFSMEIALLNPHNVPIDDSSSRELIPKYLEFIQNNPNLPFVSNGGLLYVTGNEGELFVALATNNGTQFNLIAYSSKDLKIDFSNDLACFQEAYNLKCMKKCFYNLKYVFTLPCLGYVKYAQCMIKVISTCGGKSKPLFSRVADYIRGDGTSTVWCKCLLVIFLIPLLLIYYYLALALSYQVAIFPFQAMVFPLLYYSFGVTSNGVGVNPTYMLVYPTLFASLFVMFFPQIKFPFGRKTDIGWKIDFRNDLQVLLNRFQVKPKKNNMHLLSLLIQKKDFDCKDFKETLCFCLCMCVCASCLFNIYEPKYFISGHRDDWYGY